MTLRPFSSSSSFEWTRFLLRVIFLFFFASTTALIAGVAPGSEARAWSQGENATSTVYKKVCRGSAHGFSNNHGNSATNRYFMYRAQYSNCTYVHGNLVITFLDEKDDYDMSFLEDIQEVTGYVLLIGNHFSYVNLKNLRIIRGRSLFFSGKENSIGYSFFIANNYKENSTTVGLKELQLTSLHEIMDGNVYIYNNNLLCFDNTIDWKDILTGEGTEVIYKDTLSQEKRQCKHCHEDCTYNNERYCWGEGHRMCQNLTKVICSKQCDGRCFGIQPNECCHQECAGGCNGPYKNNCFACKNFVDGGDCVGMCPTEFKYQDFKFVPNPKAKFAFGTLCVQQCPDHLITDMGACVSDCGHHRMAHKGKCIPCDGPCPKTCPGTGDDFLHSLNINNFTDCTAINGNIRILQTSFDGDHHRNISGLNVDQLSVLETIQEITGFLMVQVKARNFTSLSFLKNLRIIHGREVDLSGSSLQIVGTSLESFGLNSLKSVLKGQIMVADNDRLCFADQLNWSSLFTARSPMLKRMNIRIVKNRNYAECAEEGRICSEHCSSDGCWGPGPGNCFTCDRYLQERMCVARCDHGWYAVMHNGTRECIRCHEECRSSCTGEDADRCDACLHVKDGPYCVSKCPTFKYEDQNGTCQMCHENCLNGCTGPANTVGPTGCNACGVVVYEGQSGDPPLTFKPVFCLAPESDCHEGFYKQYILATNTTPRHQACFRCRPECKTCTGSDLSFCTSCVHYVEGSRCVLNCSSNYYADDLNSRCVECDGHCLRCTGPTSADCLSCRDLKLYEDLDRRNISPFNCTAKCPDSSPVRIIETLNGEIDSICVPEAYAEAYIGHPERKQIGMIVSISLGSLVFIGIIVVVIVYLRRQWARSEENKIRLTARMSGLEECEPLSPSNAKPDMAMLRLIKESELQRGNIIGSGAFGTVYKGAWIPAGENVKIPVAIKVLQEGTSPNQNKELLEEARIMASVEHQCCIRILAVCMTAQMMLVTQLMPLGCLLDYVRKNKANVGSKVLLNWSTQIARGMKYLEERGIVHRDLAARNVLVQSPAQVKITDFGLSKLLDFNEEHIQAAGGKMPIKWLALECIQHRIFTHKSDVWSFGVTMWELYTYGQRPYENVLAKDIPDLLEKGERLPQPMICTIDVYMIMIKCWMLDAESRPLFHELAEEFAKMARDPGRFLVVPGDKLMRLPTQTYDTRDLLAGAGGDGPEEVMSAEEYLQPQGLLQSASNCSLHNVHREMTREQFGGNSRYHVTSANHERSNRGNGVDGYLSSQRREPRYGGLETTSSSQHMQRVFGPVGGRDHGGRDHTGSRYSSDPCKSSATSMSDSRSSEPVSTMSQDSGLVISQDDPGKNLLDLEDRVRIPYGEDDYLQPKMSATSTYLDLVDGSDSEEVTRADLSKPEISYMLISKDPQSAICNPEYFESFASAKDSKPSLNGSVPVSVENRLDLHAATAAAARLPKSTVPDHYSTKCNCSGDQKSFDSFMKPFTESEV